DDADDLPRLDVERHILEGPQDAGGARLRLPVAAEEPVQRGRRDVGKHLPQVAVVGKRPRPQAVLLGQVVDADGRFHRFGVGKAPRSPGMPATGGRPTGAVDATRGATASAPGAVESFTAPAPMRAM